MIQTPKTATFTRPNDTTAYSANDVVTNSTTVGAAMQFAGGFPGSDKVDITRVLAQKSTATTTASDGVLHLFARDPGVQNDNGAFSALAFSAAEPYGYLGSVAIAIFASKAGSSSVISENVLSTPLSLVHASALSGTIYGVFMLNGAYAPGANEVFQFTLFGKPTGNLIVTKIATFFRPNDTTAYASGASSS